MPKTAPKEEFVAALRGGCGTYLDGTVRTFYCGNCGREEVAAKPKTLNLLHVLPDGEDSWICKDRKICRAHHG